MRRLLVLLVCGLFALPQLSGCQRPDRDKSGVAPAPPRAGVEVIVEGGDEFPEFLVGTWRAGGGGGWEVVFEPDGTISSAVHAMGRVRLKPGEKTVIPIIKGGKGIFEPGEWIVHYIPADRELTVKISLSNFYTELGDDVLEGKSTDVFVGEIDEEGNIWETNWTSFFDYTAHTAKNPNFKMSSDPNYGHRKNLVFKKVSAE